MPLSVKIGVVFGVLFAVGAATSKPPKYYILESRHTNGLVVTLSGQLSHAACNSALEESLSTYEVAPSFAYACTPHY